MQPINADLKVNNEIELCEVYNPECKKEIERQLLKNRISYYIRWPRTSFLSRKKDCCIICINDNSKEMAEEVVKTICEDNGFAVKFLLRPSANKYL